MKSIGIIGGGQLAQMLLKAGLEAGLDVRAYCQTLDDPAYSIGKNNVIGTLDDPIALRKFIDSVDVCTFESEFVNCDQLAEFKFPDSKYSPSLKVMKKLQDRKTQKESIDLYKLPSLPFFHSPYGEWIEKAAKELKYKVVFKARRNSYDGYGTHLCKSQSDVSMFLKQHPDDLDSFIMEPLFKFKRELALTVYRSKDGSSGSYPLVEWKAKDSKCHWVMGPIQSSHLAKFEKRALKYLEHLGYVGTMSFEVFESSKGFFVNELAPRVHNSCHYSLDAMGLNQFTMHLNCLLGSKTPRHLESYTKGFAMVNLIGTGSKQTKLVSQNDSRLYWYGKTVNRKGRKLGHINAISNRPKEALKSALKGAKLCQL